MHAELISSLPLLVVFAGSLMGQSVTLTVSGEGTPKVSPTALVLHSPDYAFVLKCRGGPWKFQFPGSAEFRGAPNHRPDEWWDCPETLSITLPVSSQPAKLSFASASGETTPGTTAVVSISWAAQVNPEKANSGDTALRETLAMVVGVIGFLAGAVSLMLTLVLQRRTAAADAARGIEQTRNAKDTVRLTELISKVEVLSQSHSTAHEKVQRDIEQLRQEIRNAKNSKEHLKQLERPIDAAKPMGREAPIPQVLLLPDDSGGELAKVDAAPLLLAVEAWGNQAPNPQVQPPSQLAEKIGQLRAMVQSAAELSETGSPDSAKDWQDLASSIAILIADHTDEHIDPGREDFRWQILLQKIFESAGVDPLVPSRNESVRELEHHLVGSTPRQSASDASYRVACVRQRGFRMDGRVIRKAAVTAYD